MKNQMKKILCSNLKGKMKITNSLLILFLITGGTIFANGVISITPIENHKTLDEYGEHIGALDNFAN
ncbi:hypothetical protein, partial [uncultured Cetobacterium sp.]|uniref:hypothetical protein n=1 Tax=uncultured Cetobacterium sp. TaxID=527638 RepID=UPI00262387A5